MQTLLKIRYTPSPHFLMINTTKNILIPNLSPINTNINNNHLSPTNNNVSPSHKLLPSRDQLTLIIDNDLENTHSDDRHLILNRNTLTFATHNVHSLRDDVKNNKILDTFHQKNVNFVALSETWHQSSQSYRCSSDPNFDTLWSSVSNKFTGVGLLISKSWSKHIAKKFLDNDRYIYVDLYLKGNVKLRVFSIYIHATESKERKVLQTTLLRLIDYSLQSGFHIIIMGDFNADLIKLQYLINSGKTILWKYDLVHGLVLKNFLDLYDICHDTPLPTFKRSNTASRIDAIFASQNLVSDFLYCNIIHSYLYKSDHEIVIAYFSNIQHESQSHSRINDTKRKVLLLKSMDPSKWTNFAEYSNTYYHNHNYDRLKDLSSNQTNMNNLWMEVKKAVLDISKSKIPHKWIFSQDREPKPKDLSQYYPLLTKIEKILLKFRSKRLNERLWPIGEEWKRDLNIVATIVKDISYPLDPLPLFLNSSNVREAKKSLNSIYKVLCKLTKMDAKKNTDAQIKSLIGKRCDQLESQPGKMIDSILQRKKRRITLDRVFINNNDGSKQFTLDPDEIKKVAINHFQNNAVPSTLPRSLDGRWISQYQTKEYISENIYDNIMQPPTYNEWCSVLSHLAKDKAAGPSGIHNEMFQHLGDKFKHLVWQLICMCFTIGDTPSEWKIAHVYPIPKPMEWECDITKTHPITLLETLRKAFVKVITNRLSKILAKHHVLKGNNFAGLPGGSTEKPIKIINMLLEDANENKKELWILLQDLSKAYDRVDLKFLRLALQRIKIPVKCVDLIINLFTNRKNAIFTADGLTDYYDIKIGIDQGEVISPLL